MKQVSEEARNLLAEIIKHETEPDYWQKRFEQMKRQEEIIVRGCFGELEKNNLIYVFWADNIPYQLEVLKDGYKYEDQMYDTESNKLKADIHLSPFEREMYGLLYRSKSINPPKNAASIGTDIDEYNRPSNIWVNDFEIFYKRYLTDHPLAKRIETILFHRQLSAYSELISILESISGDEEFRKQNYEKQVVSDNKGAQMKEYDVFLSHADKDKNTYVNRLHKSLSNLGVKIYYDKESLEWGDRWKEHILDGTAKSEFAIIVISENFFDREWTEKELNEFLNRQNEEGQKMILPITHKITLEQLRKKYPSVADIQALDSSNYTCDEIALQFARQLIKRLKNVK